MREPSIGSSNMTSRGFLSSFQCSILRYVQSERTQQAVSVLPSTGSSSTTPKISVLIFSDHEFYVRLLDLDIKSGSKESADSVFGPFASRTPAPPPLSDTAGFRPSPFLSHLLFLVNFRFCRPPAVISSFPPRTRACTDRSGSRPSRSGCRPAHPTSRPAHRPRSQAVENALRTGGACVYGRKPPSPQKGAASRRCGILPTRRAGAPPAGPPPADDRALESGVDAVTRGWIYIMGGTPAQSEMSVYIIYKALKTTTGRASACRCASAVGLDFFFLDSKKLWKRSQFCLLHKISY